MKITTIIGWGDTEQDCIDYLDKNPTLKKLGYIIAQLGNVWVIGKKD